MNKKYIILILCSVILLASLPGCAMLDPEDQYYEYKVPGKKLHTITPIEPNQFTAPKPAPAKEQTPDAKAEMKAEPNLPPPPEMQMSLEECRATTLQNNLELQSQLIAPAISAAAVGAEEAKFEAAFYANTSLSNTDSPGSKSRLDTSGYSSGYGASQYHNVNSRTGVQMPLRTGGTLDFSLADSRTHNLAPGTSPQYQNNFTFSVSQPLLKNAGQRVNMHSIRLARYEKQITDNTTKLEVIRVLAAADRSYWRLYAARKELEVRKEQHKLATAQLERAKRMVNAGQMANIEIVRAEAGVARQLAAIISAENNLRTRQREFKRVLNRPGLDIETPTIMIPATEADPVHYTFDTPKLIDQAFENRAELLELELRIAEDVSKIDYLNNQMLPLVTMDYTYNVTGTGMTRNDSYDMLNKKNYENHRIGVSLWVPLGNEAAKNNLRQAMYVKRQRLATKASQRQLVKQEVLDALDQAEANWQQIMAARQDALLEGDLYQAEVRQFEVGLRTSTDVLDIQTKLADAQSAEITALVNYEISLVDMAYATGTLLGADKIEWQATTPIVPVK
ncbi:MAG: TolC family protein [Planctomycetes bacterium]|nr:TolC family protein [Planctomycetota bacterium]